MWLARLRNAGDAAPGGAKREMRPYASSELQRSADSATSSMAPTPRIRAGGVRLAACHLTEQLLSVRGTEERQGRRLAPDSEGGHLIGNLSPALCKTV